VLFARVGRLEVGALSVPWPDAASFDARTAVPLVAAFGMLFVARRGIVATLATCAALGVATSWVARA
jgi:hypothetical protein